MKTVNIDGTERDELRRTLREIHEDTIFIIISDNRVNGVSASQIEEKIKNKNLKLNGQTIYSHLSGLLKKHRIYKDSGRYFPKNSPLNEISTMSAKLNDVLNFVLDPVFSLEPSTETKEVIPKFGFCFTCQRSYSFLINILESLMSSSMSSPALSFRSPTT